MSPTVRKKSANSETAEARASAPMPIDAAKAKAAIDAIKDRERTHPQAVDFARQRRIAKLRRKLGKDLQPLLADAGVDQDRIDKLLKANQAELRQTLAQAKAHGAKPLAERAKLRDAGLANTRSAIEAIAFKPYLTTAIPVATPFLIGATPAGILTDSRVEPWNNWAKAILNFSQDTSGSTAKVSFYFAWQNPTQYLAVINCAADLIANGTFGGDAQPGFFSGGSVSLDMRAELTIYAGGTEISWQQGQNIEIDSFSTYGGGIFGFGPVVNKTVSDTTHLSCTDIEVQGNQLIVVEVAFVGSYSIDDGNVDADFSSAGNALVCPVLNIELLTAPGGSPITRQP